MKYLKKRMGIILISAVATLFLVVLGLNFIPPEKKLDRRLGHLYAPDSAQFMREMGSLLGPTIVMGNRVEPLQNGAEIFPAMLAAIRVAQRSITFETYIYWSGRIGAEFAEALSERARAGVKVHVLLDWLGSAKMDPEVVEDLRSAGVEVNYYHPLKWYHIARMNNRTHRKVLVVDGHIGFTGGVGVADQWNGHAQDSKHWRDMHFRFEGPVVAQAQAVFVDNWIKTTGSALQGEDYFPHLVVTDGIPAQMFMSSPSGGSDSMQLMYLMAIASAGKSIDLSAAYFVPDDVTMAALAAALKRGVQLRIITPGKHTDADSVRTASRARWGELLEAGADIFEYEPTMFHCKAMIVDDFFVSVGSTNFDNRSFRLNAEASLNLYDNAFAQRMSQVFVADLARSRRVTLAEWQRRPWQERIKEWLVAPFASQL